MLVAAVVHAAYGTARVAATFRNKTRASSALATSVTWLANIAHAMNAIAHSSKNVWISS